MRWRALQSLRTESRVRSGSPLYQGEVLHAALDRWASSAGLFERFLAILLPGALKFGNQAGNVDTGQQPVFRCHPAGSLDPFSLLFLVDTRLLSHARIIPARRPRLLRAFTCFCTHASFSDIKSADYRREYSVL